MSFQISNDFYNFQYFENQLPTKIQWLNKEKLDKLFEWCIWKIVKLHVNLEAEAENLPDDYKKYKIIKSKVDYVMEACANQQQVSREVYTVLCLWVLSLCTEI